MKRERLTPDELYEAKREVGLRSAEAKWRDHTKKASPWPVPRPGPKSSEWQDWVKETDAGPHDRLALEHLELSVRTLNALELANVTTIGDLTALTAGEVTDLAKLDGHALEKVKNALARFGKGLNAQRQPAPAPPPDPRVVQLRQRNAELDRQVVELRAALYNRPKVPPEEPPNPAFGQLVQENLRHLQTIKELKQALQRIADENAQYVRMLDKLTRCLEDANEALRRAKPAPASLDYPRMMFHRTLDPVVVSSRDEEISLGGEWSRTVFAPVVAAAVPGPVPGSVNQEVRRVRLAQSVAPVQAAESLAVVITPEGFIKAPAKLRQPAESAASWQELARRLGRRIDGED